MPGLNAGESLAISVEPAADARSVTVGRSTENDVVIDDATLSRTHMRLERGEDGRWSAVDLGSSNGTSVDGVVARGQAVPLKNGSVIEAGAVRLTFHDGGGFYQRLTGKGPS
jgi:pSer/pThr/pTyr-binding forkhead associated (FHA) protein